MGTIQTSEIRLLTAHDYDVAYSPLGGCAHRVVVSGNTQITLDAFLYGEQLQATLSSTEITLQTNNIQFAQFSNEATYPFTCEIVCDGANIAVLINGDTIGVTSNVSLEYNAETVYEMPDYTQAAFVETDNSVLQTIKSIIGDRPITLAASKDGTVRLYLLPHYEHNTLDDDALASISLRKASAVPKRARVMSYEISEIDIENGAILGTAIVRMNCDANPVGYAKRAIAMKFNERIGLVVNNEHIFDIGDTISAFVTSQVTGDVYTVTGEIISVTITPSEDRYVIVRNS